MPMESVPSHSVTASHHHHPRAYSLPPMKLPWDMEEINIRNRTGLYWGFSNNGYTGQPPGERDKLPRLKSSLLGL